MAVGESETIRRGFLAIVTLPPAVTIVTGNDAGAAPPAPAETNRANTAIAAPAAKNDERST